MHLKECLQRSITEYGVYRLVILGIPGTGKSTLLRSVHPGYPILTPVPESAVDVKVLTQSEIAKYYQSAQPGSVMQIDEADRFFARRDTTLKYILDYHRHRKVSLTFVARRPTSLLADVVELATDMAVFYLPGADDRSYLNSWMEGLGDRARALENHHYVLVHSGRVLGEEEICRDVTDGVPGSPRPSLESRLS